MKPHPRVRTTVKWGGMFLSLLLLTVWLGSGARYMSWSTGTAIPKAIPGFWSSTPGTAIQIARGRISIGVVDTNLVWGHPPGGLRFVPMRPEQPYQLEFWFEHRRSRSGSVTRVPLWPLVLITMIATAAAWRADCRTASRRRRGLCAICGYSNRGLPPGAGCPECGTASLPAPRA